MQRSDIDNKLIYLLATSERINKLINDSVMNGKENTEFMHLYNERDLVIKDVANFIELNKNNFVFSSEEQKKFDKILELEKKNIKLLENLTDKISKDIKKLSNSKKLLTYSRQK